MAEILLRIDDRLLHGQVLLGWATSFRPRIMLLANDEIASDEDQRALYTSLGEDDYEIRVESLSNTVKSLARQSTSPPRTLIVVRSPADALRLLDLGLVIEEINVGGLHHAEGKKRLLDYVFLSAQDVSDLEAILERGVRLEARDLPGARRCSLEWAQLQRLWA